MSDFNAAIKTVLAHEGGFVNNPSDRGGPTNFGITQASATAYLGGAPASVAYIQALTPEIAAAIYRKLFWEPLHLDEIVSQSLATVVLDLAVLRGIPSVVRAIQGACRLPADGVMGLTTLAVFKEQAHDNPSFLALEVVLHCQYLFVDFAVRNSNQLQFLEGWIARTQELIRIAVQ
jgi:lysozyme family protein